MKVLFTLISLFISQLLFAQTPIVDWAKCYGGTVVDPAIAYINKECKDVASIVYLTDGYVSLTKVKPLKPMIVVLTSNGISIESFRSSWGNNFKILKIDSK